MKKLDFSNINLSGKANLNITTKGGCFNDYNKIISSPGIYKVLTYTRDKKCFFAIPHYRGEFYYIHPNRM